MEDLITHKKKLVHVERLKFYSDSNLDITEELLQTVERNDPHYYTVTQILDLRFNEGTKNFEVQCNWRGFSDDEYTWEPFNIIREDIPDMLEKFRQNFSNQKPVNTARFS